MTTKQSKKTLSLPSVDELAEAGAQLGHFKNKCLPKMQPFIVGLRNNIHFIDLEKTLLKLEEAVNFVREQVAAGAEILFLGTKPVAKDIVTKFALESGVPYVNQRWLGGTLTNFATISKLIKKFNKMTKDSQSGEWEKYTKKERLEMERELKKLETMIGGIKDLKKKPDLIYVIDIVHEKTAIEEAQKCKIPVVAMVDTNANPELVDFPIPINDDSLKTIEIITKLITEAVIIGQAENPSLVAKEKGKKEKSEEKESKGEQKEAKKTEKDKKETKKGNKKDKKEKDKDKKEK
ncbi:30S ribosomal protein S2 [Patescibacteria group bacterium]|nr:30S ribosomal protein S2 [Patescibacteria group bacterium]